MEAKLGCGPPLLHAYLQFCYLLLPKKKFKVLLLLLGEDEQVQGFVSYCFTNDCIHARWPKNKLSRASKSAIALCSNRNCPRLIWCCAPPLPAGSEYNIIWIYIRYPVPARPPPNSIKYVLKATRASISTDG